MKALIALLCFCGFVLGDDRHFDEISGADTRNYPPDVQVDFQHLLLEIDMPEPAGKAFRGVETLSFKTLGLPLRSLKLNAVDLEIEKVSDGRGQALHFRTDDNTLTIRFDPPISPNTDATVRIEYSCSNPKDGMIFAVPDASYPDRPLHVHTQGQSESNRYWFASHDYPNERMISEIKITIPARFKALANGALVSHTESGGSGTWHYKLSKPHVSYLVSLIVGEFDVHKDTWRDIPVEYWVPPGSPESDVKRTFGRTAQMLDVFSKLLGVDYPYEKYSQAVVYMFSAGGMENTSATTLTEDMLVTERAGLDRDREGLIAHELGHQWFGDMITCRSWSHVWLNEGFASYMDAAWLEHGFSRDHYDYEIWDTFRTVAENDDVSASGGGLVWRTYEQGGETFRRRVSNPYSKGESVIHMLRMKVGDELFWKIIAEYVRRNAWKSVETDDLRVVFDELTGRSFEQFFQQWVYRPGTPAITATYQWDTDARLATVSLEQTQKISEQAPAFVADVPVWLVHHDGSVTRHTIAMTGREATITIPCEQEPAQVCLDPHLSLLAKWKWSMPTTMLARIARNGPTLGVRLNAVAQLSNKDKRNVVATLAELTNDPSAFFGLRVESAKALGTMRTVEARDALLAMLVNTNPIADHKVRRAVVDAVAKYKNEAVAETLRRLAASDASSAVEAAATTGLGHQSPSRQNLDVLLANAQKHSYRDEIRLAALEAIARIANDLDEASRDAAVQVLVGAVGYGQPFRSRPPAIDALAALGAAAEPSSSVRDRALSALENLLDDPQNRSRTAAVRALGKLEDERAIEPLQRLADAAVDETLTRAARASITAIRDAQTQPGALQDLRRRLDEMETDRTDGRRRP